MTQQSSRNTRVLSLRVPKGLFERLDDLAVARGESRTQLMLSIMQEGLEARLFPSARVASQVPQSVWRCPVHGHAAIDGRCAVPGCPRMP